MSQKKRNPQFTEAFHQYCQDISTAIIDKYGPSYTRYQDVYNTWRRTMPYTESIGDFLILQSRCFLIHHSSFPIPWLKDLTNEMADYLSLYFMRDEKFETRKDTKKYLVKCLFDNNRYISNLIMHRQQKREKYIGLAMTGKKR